MTSKTGSTRLSARRRIAVAGTAGVLAASALIGGCGVGGGNWGAFWA